MVIFSRTVERFQTKKSHILLFVLAIGVVGAFLVFGKPLAGTYSELQTLNEKNMSFEEISDFFENIANEKGGAYAYEILKRADLPANVDLHLLGHVIGDELYKQEGIAGIATCTHDFRNACSHSVVIGTLLEYGESSLPDIREACLKAPGGKGAYTMCFHGLGHGVLAYLDYDFTHVADFCRQVGTPEYGEREYIECVGGAVMEMVSGVHDPATWEEAKKKYFVEGKPFALCDSSFVPDDVKAICYTYITPELLTAVGADLARPTPENFTDAFKICHTVVRPDLRDICYASLGKEFVALARDRDIRAVETATDSQLKTMYEWCTLAESRSGAESCMKSALQSLFWGGENNRSASVRFCSLISDAEHQDSCFRELTGAVGYYIDDMRYYKSYCSEIPERLREECRSTLGV